MTAKPLETKVIEGKEYIAIARTGCSGCAFERRRDCDQETFQCASERGSKSLIWLTPEKAALARLRGEASHEH